MPTTDTDETAAWLRLTLTPGLGNLALRKLLAQLGSPAQVLAARSAELRNFVPADIASLISSGGNVAAAEQALAWLGEPANHVVTLGDTDYPQLLLQTADPPPLLYVKGRLDLMNRPALAVVGSRNATTQGANNAAEFARALSDAGITIISGLALILNAGWNDHSSAVINAKMPAVQAICL